MKILIAAAFLSFPFVLGAPSLFAANAAAPPSKDSIETVKGSGAQAAKENTLIASANAAIARKDWAGAVEQLQPLIALAPRWRYLRALADAKANLGFWQDALDVYEAALKSARAEKPAKGGEDRLTSALEQMLVAEGNMNLKLKNAEDAIKLYADAAALSKHPATADFNICAVSYNVGDSKNALIWCDKTIAVDPKKADAYFIKGSLMIADSQLGKDNKVVAAPGTAETLWKYLELAPDGAHAKDVREMLTYIGSTFDPARPPK